jgi:tight adherence protein C
VTALLAAIGGLLVFAAAWELAGLGAPARLRRLRARLRRRSGTPPATRLAGAAGGGVCFVLVAPATPGRLVPVLLPALLAAGAIAPDAIAQRAGRRRRARLVAALPDALDLLAVGAAAGRSPGPLLAEIAAATSGPLAAELRMTVADLDTGVPMAGALEALRRRTGARELGALASALERSRLFGSPLADQLHAQAAALRRDERRRIAEHAARAAPKIQLVVALVLVPSALLAVAAALIAHADALFGAL